MYFLWEKVNFQPAMLVYQRVIIARCLSFIRQALPETKSLENPQDIPTNKNQRIQFEPENVFV